MLEPPTESSASRDQAAIYSEHGWTMPDPGPPICILILQEGV